MLWELNLLSVVSCYCLLFRSVTTQKDRFDRLLSRKESIKNKFSSSVETGGWMENRSKRDDLVWINGNFLRRFVSCSDDCGLENIQITREGGKQFLIRNGGEKCPHGHMHPKKARNGKIIPMSWFEEIGLILVNEWECLHKNTVNETKFPEMGRPQKYDYIIALDEIRCPTCVEEYNQKMRDFISQLENFMNLMRALNDWRQLQNDEGPKIPVSTLFIYSFQKCGDDLCHAHEVFFLSEDVDSFDLSKITARIGDSKITSPVNKDIVCEYL